jgi:hypothetical protein
VDPRRRRRRQANNNSYWILRSTLLLPVGVHGSMMICRLPITESSPMHRGAQLAASEEPAAAASVGVRPSCLELRDKRYQDLGEKLKSNRTTWLPRNNPRQPVASFRNIFPVGVALPEGKCLRTNINGKGKPTKYRISNQQDKISRAKEIMASQSPTAWAP